MDITRKNYEAYFIDYLEGNLDVNLVDRFIEFLQENPDLKEELTLFESVTAVSENAEFTGKEKLYKEKYDLEDEFNQAAVATLEEDLEETEKHSFEKYLSVHPEKNKELDLFTKTILQADENIRFEHKNQLYRKPSRKIILFWAGRVAAVLILALAVFSLFNQNSKTHVPEYQAAQIEVPENIVPKPEIPIQELKITEPQKTEPLAFAIKTNSEKKKIQDNTISEENLIIERIPIKIPGQMNTLAASLDAETPKARLATMTLVYPIDESDDEHFLADKIEHKINLKKIAKAGLNLVATLSNDRFTYETDNEGKVIEYKYDSRLLAFSIPSIRTEPK